MFCSMLKLIFTVGPLCSHSVSKHVQVFGSTRIESLKSLEHGIKSITTWHHGINWVPTLYEPGNMA